MAGDVSISLSGKALTVASRRTESLLVIRSQINAEDGIKCASQPLAGTEAAERDGGNGPRLLNSYCIHSYCIHAAAFSALRCRQTRAPNIRGTMIATA